MAAAGKFVRERLPVPCSVPEAGRLILELVSSTRDCEAEHAGPMTFRVVRRYRPTWASATAFLIVPLFVRTTEVCRVAVIEARMGAELLLEGTLDADLHRALTQLGRVPEAARVSTLDPRPVPQGLAPPPPPPSSRPGAPRAGSSPSTPQSFRPSSDRTDRPELIDLRDSSRPVGTPDQRPSRDDEFADLIPPPLLPPGRAPSSRPAAPSGPAPDFAPLHARADHAGGNGSNGAWSNGRLPSAFRSGRDEVQPDGVPAPPAPERPTAAQAPETVVSRAATTSRSVSLTVDSGEEAVVHGLLVIGRAPSRRDLDPNAELLTVNDPSLSVSKTHLAVELDGDGLWVTDRNSTNGTWIDEGRGALRPVPAGERTAVPAGARVLIGERVITFVRENA